METTNIERHANFGESKIEQWIPDTLKNSGDKDYSDSRSLQIALDSLQKEMLEGRLRKITYKAAVNILRPLIGERLYDLFKLSLYNR